MGTPTKDRNRGLPASTLRPGDHIQDNDTPGRVHQVLRLEEGFAVCGPSIGGAWKPATIWEAGIGPAGDSTPGTWSRRALPAPGQQKPPLSEEQRRRLLALANRSTRYEAAVTHPRTGACVLLGYLGRRSKRGLAAAAASRGEAILAFLGTANPRGKDTKGKLEIVMEAGGTIAMTGRTERDAILEGELPRLGAAPAAKAPEAKQARGAAGVQDSFGF